MPGFLSQIITGTPTPVILQTTVLLVLSNVFMTFAVFSMRQPLKLDYLWAALCIGGAVFFMVREG